MNPILIAALVVLILFVVLQITYVICIRPSKKNQEEMQKYKGVKFAHRGLHNDEVPENSLTAFRLAVEAGFGIELDVHTAKCGTPVVFHDGTLTRMTGTEDRLCNFTASELSEMRLKGTDEKIPTFAEVLELVGGKVPLVVELKQDEGEEGVAQAAADLLKKYDGPFIVESFNPFTLADFGRCMPNVPRGILSQRFTNKEGKRKLKFFIAEHMLTNAVCKPDFIAFSKNDARFISLRMAKAIYEPFTIAWTIRSPEEEAHAYQNGFDSVIFENYIPEK